MPSTIKEETMRPALIVVLAGVLLVARRRRARPDRDVWHEATTMPDLR